MIKKRTIGTALCLCFVLFPAPFIPAQSLSSVPRLTAGVNLYSQGKWREAVLELRRVQAEASSRELRAEALFWISLAELSAGEFNEALRDMDAVAETDPGNRRLPELPYHRGRALFYLGRYDEAIVFLSRYSESLVPRPGFVPSAADISQRAAALYWTGECLFSMGQLDRAADYYRFVTDEYPGSSKHEASLYRLDMINQKKTETELLSLLKLSHEESLKNMEEYRRREQNYEQALNAYQRRIAEITSDTRIQDLENSNAQYRQQLESAEARIRSLENTLRGISVNER
jgi:TolA-binding protein